MDPSELLGFSSYLEVASNRDDVIDTWIEVTRDEAGEFWFCAPSFEEFVVRTWLENIAWYSLNLDLADRNELRWPSAPEVREYLDHYRNGTGS